MFDPGLRSDSKAVRKEADREYWRGALSAGGFTAIPRWTLDPVAGVAEHEAAIPHDLVAAVRRLADDLALPLGTVLLAAHAKVLAALSGDPAVVIGYVAQEGGRPLPLRLTTHPDSWRALLRGVHREETELLRHRDFPVDELGRELELTPPAFETVLDPTGARGDLAEDTVLWVGATDHGGRPSLRLRYRTEALDADAAARVAGYHLTALALMGADPDAEHGRQSLLSAEELQFQLEGLAGPRRELPDRRAHELFEERVRAHPDAVAAVHGDREWTYEELNLRANRLGRALLARGLGREGVVGVVCERNLDWMAAVLAVFKAGGVYLPIEPHFPPDRIATTLSRAGCGLVVTERGSTTTLDQALDSLPGVQTLFVDEAYEQGHAGGDLGIAVAPDQLAYIYFTSGSTGEPKGAMCEHAGMLNHLYAKIDDLEIGERQVVAQTAPQCFDISLWQLVSALLVGGRTVLVEQEVVLDVERFVDKIADARVNVVQVVPSYLEAVLSYLEQHPHELTDLRCVSVTGEALKKELTQRWFAAERGIKLVNAYGLTETSDDTNHEVMDRVPDRERVPLGPPVNNVHVYVVDEQMSPVPLGAPGEIVFSGVCVGRGYVNDPDRTRSAFGTDPHREDQRLYRGGDYGRWLPEGKLEFLGRRDTQVKVSGFRIEIGEVENALVRVPGVHHGAVVVAERGHQSKHLVAFYSGPQPLEVDVLRDRLGESLPAYMVPTAFHWRESLPLTQNGKIDRKALTALAGELEVAEEEHHPPATPTEHRLAAAWATVLGVPKDHVGRWDHFFESGGTSLSAVKLVIALERAVSLKDVTRHPVLADLARLVDGRSEPRSGLLQSLSEADGRQTGALVCFPYAGGNAVNFQPMARALRGSGLAVYAVELPGHDVAAQGEPFVSMAQVVEQVVAEVTRHGLTEVLLWGHSSGAAFALETAWRLQERGVHVQRVFLGAQLLGDAADRRATIAELTGRRPAEIAARLSADSGYTELGELDAQRAEHVGAAYRHDCMSANRYLADALDDPPAVKLSAPVTVVVADDDPSTAESSRRHRDWQLLAEHVDLHELADGGHHFLRTRPTDAAQAVLRAAGSSTRSSVATRKEIEMPYPSPASPLDVDLQPGRPPVLRVAPSSDAPTWAAEHRDALRAVVAEHGAVLVRGLGLRDASEVGAVFRRLADGLMTEREAFAARQVYSDGIYSSANWPPKQPMCMHHELSYTLEVPSLMLFACLAAPSDGGATAVADSPTVLDALPAELVERFEREGWLLTRNYNDEIGASYAEAFGTEDRDAIESYCRANAIELEWQPDGGLRTRQRRSAVVRHPVTGRRCWFNQIAFLSEWTIASEVREYLVEVYGADGLPFNTSFGSGEPIGEEVVELLNDVYEAHTAREPWQAGDLMLVDNVRTAHSREPYEGQREVLVAMADPVRLRPADRSGIVEVSAG